MERFPWSRQDAHETPSHRHLNAHGDVEGRIRRRVVPGKGQSEGDPGGLQGTAHTVGHAVEQIPRDTPARQVPHEFDSR